MINIYDIFSRKEWLWNEGVTHCVVVVVVVVVAVVVVAVIGNSEDPLFGRRCCSNQGSQKRCPFDSSQELSARETDKSIVVPVNEKEVMKYQKNTSDNSHSQNKSVESTDQYLAGHGLSIDVKGNKELESKANILTASVGTQTAGSADLNVAKDIDPVMNSQHIENNLAQTQTKGVQVLQRTVMSKDVDSDSCGTDPIRAHTSQTSSEACLASQVELQSHQMDTTNVNMCMALEKHAGWSTSFHVPKSGRDNWVFSSGKMESAEEGISEGLMSFTAAGHQQQQDRQNGGDVLLTFRNTAEECGSQRTGSNKFNSHHHETVEQRRNLNTAVDSCKQNGASLEEFRLEGHGKDTILLCTKFQDKSSACGDEKSSVGHRNQSLKVKEPLAIVYPPKTERFDQESNNWDGHERDPSAPYCCECDSRLYSEMKDLKEKLEQAESTVVWQSLMIRLYKNE